MLLALLCSRAGWFTNRQLTAEFVPDATYLERFPAAAKASTKAETKATATAKEEETVKREEETKEQQEPLKEEEQPTKQEETAVKEATQA